MNELTDFKFWENYWADVDIQATSKDVFFKDLIVDFPNNVNSIEIGGFPGKLAVYFNKVKQCNVTILDFFISNKIIEKVETINEIKKGTINTIKADFLTFKSDKKYSIVCSFGFIEHFEDTKDIIKKHLELLENEGNLLITLPNFKGINGWVQKIFDKNNYDAHNIRCMDLVILKEVCKDLKLENYDINYFGKPTIWIEDEKKLNRINRLFLKVLQLSICYIPLTNKFLSPFIYIKAKK